MGRSQVLARADVTVIGAGVVGASIAQALTAKGLAVVVVDGGQTAAAGCSYANAGIIAPDHVAPLMSPSALLEAPVQMIRRPPAVRVRPHPDSVTWLAGLVRSAATAAQHSSELRALAWRSAELHQHLATQYDGIGLRKQGATTVLGPRLPRHVYDMLHRAARPAGAEFERYAIYEADEWVLESRTFARTLLDAAAHDGALVRFGVMATGIRSERGHVTGVDTDAGVIESEHVVLASGMGTRHLATSVGLRVPLRGGRGYGVDLAVPAHAVPTMSVRLQHYRVVITPFADRVRICGAIDFGFDGTPGLLRRGEALREVATRMLPGLRGRPVLDRWIGDRPCSPDGMPLIGPSQRVRGLNIAAGHGMWGMILAPVTAELVTRAVTDGDAPQYDWLNPDRFTR